MGTSVKHPAQPSGCVNANRVRLGATGLIAVGGVVAVLVCSSCSSPQAAPARPDAGVKINTNTPPGVRTRQTLDMLNSDSPIEPIEVRTLATADMVPIIRYSMENLWWDRPFTVSGVDYHAGQVILHLLNSFGAGHDIEIHTDEAGMVDRFEADVIRPAINSWADVDAELAKSHARYSYQVAKVNGGRCERVAGTNTAESLPLASIFKLYVLYAVAGAVRTGILSWDDRLTITSRVKAVEFAGLEEFPLGSTVSVRTAAEKMIASSYNTATDLLIGRIGTSAVERALVAAGHHDPQSMTPFPTMYELLSVGWGKPDLRQEWQGAVAADSPLARARLLDRADSAAYQPDPQRIHSPASAYGVEWYGNAEDICRVHAALQSGAVGAAAPVRQIMSLGSDIDLGKQQWPYVGMKGGNLPGDLTFSWYAVDRSGQAWVVSFQLNWPRFHGPSAWTWLNSIATQVFALVSGAP